MSKTEIMYYMMEHFPKFREREFYNRYKKFFDRWSGVKSNEKLFVIMRLACSVLFDMPETFTAEERALLLSEREFLEMMEDTFLETTGREVVLFPDFDES